MPQPMHIAVDNEIDVLIIGAGPSGVIALRNILLDGRLKRVMCIERNEKPGGLWLKHTPAYSSLQVLKSEWALHGVKVSDKEPERRASRDSICQWVHDYVDRYDLSEYIYLMTEVVSCEQMPDQKWKCLIRDRVTKTETEYFTNHLLVCTGLENFSRIAQLPGMETAHMPIEHNLDIRDKSQMPDQELLVIGSGPSAMDMLQEACRHSTKKIYAAHRKAHLGLPDNFGIPEMALLRFLYQTMEMPDSVVSFIINCLSYLWAWYYGIEAWLPKDVKINVDIAYAFRSELVPYVHKGQLVPMITEVEKIDGKNVYLKNGKVIQPEKIICATGWDLDFTYLPSHKGMKFEELQQRLYCRFKDIQYENLYFISIANGFMCASHNADITSRAIIQIMTGQWKNPGLKMMKKNIEQVVLKGVALPGKYEMELEKEGFDMSIKY